MTFGSRAGSLALGTALAAILLSTGASAAAPSLKDFDLPAADLGTSLKAVAAAGGRDVIFDPETVDGRHAAALHGRYTTEQAIDALLAGSGLVARAEGDGLLIRGRSQPAEPADAAGSPDAASQILVTGTRIRGVEPVGSSVVRITHKDIERSGYATTQEVLQALPQNFGGGANEASYGQFARGNAQLNGRYGSGVDLRGLGPSATLVLLNGDRPPLGGTSGVFADISLIPTTAIDRIEVLADGASAIYGSDAVAGVVNVALRDDFVGAETRLRRGTADGYLNTVQASQIVGLGWTGGHFVAAYEYNHRSRLAASSRSFATEDLRRFGGGDYRSVYGNPGTISSGEQTYAIPTSQHGTDLTAADLTAGTANLHDDWEGADILPRQTVHSAYASIRQDVGSHVQLYANGLFALRTVNKRVLPSSNTSRTVPTTNPFYVDPSGTNEPVSVDYDIAADLGHETDDGKVVSVIGTAGGRLQLGTWNFDLHGAYGTDYERSRTTNLVNRTLLARALADTDSVTAFNLFGDGSNTNPATIDRVRGYTGTRGRFTTKSAIAKVDGALFELPAGAVRVAVGGEIRREAFKALPAASFTSGTAPVDLEITDFPSGRTILAAYGEIRVPLFGPANARPFLHSLNVSAAGRIEHYSDFGRTTNPKLGVDWEPVDGIRFRSSYGTSFRAPGFNDLRQGPDFIAYFPIALPDSSSPTGFSNALLLRGNDPNLRPEKARTWTVGLDLTPRFLPRATFHAGCFNVRYRDRISSPSQDIFSILNNRAAYAGVIQQSPGAALVQSYYDTPYLQNFDNIAASDITVILNAYNQNLAVVTQSGIDFDAGYSFALGKSDLELGAGGSWLLSMRQAITPTAPSVSILGRIGNPVDLRVRGRAIWTAGPASVSTFVNFTDGYRNTTVTPTQKVATYTTVDLRLGYDFADRDGHGGWKMALSATNLFNRRPPLVYNDTGAFAVGYDPDNASPIGRVLAIELSRAW